MTPRGRWRKKSRWEKLVQFRSVQERIPSIALFSLYRRDRGYYIRGGISIIRGFRTRRLDGVVNGWRRSVSRMLYRRSVLNFREFCSS